MSKKKIAHAAKEAIDIAKANKPLRRQPVKLTPVKSQQNVYRTPVQKDPFAVPVADKLTLLHAANEKMKKVRNVFSNTSTIAQQTKHHFFTSTKNSVVKQHVYQITPKMTTVTMKKKRKTKSRTYHPHAMCTNYETVLQTKLTKKNRQVSEKTVNHLHAPSVKVSKSEKMDLVLLPNHLTLTIHESIDHSTKLDQTLGYETNFTNTSFLTVDKLNKFRIDADIVSFRGDRTRPESLSTCDQNDDNVATVKFPIVEKGIFVDYQTIQNQTHLIETNASTTCCYADSYASVPFQRMPNVQLITKNKPVTLNDLVNKVNDDILIDKRESYSIDQQRYNFQFKNNTFWEIKDGKVQNMVTNVTYQSRTPNFWANCDELNEPDT